MIDVGGGLARQPLPDPTVLISGVSGSARSQFTQQLRRGTRIKFWTHVCQVWRPELSQGTSGLILGAFGDCSILCDSDDRGGTAPFPPGPDSGHLFGPIFTFQNEPA